MNFAHGGQAPYGFNFDIISEDAGYFWAPGIEDAGAVWTPGVDVGGGLVRAECSIQNVSDDHKSRDYSLIGYSSLLLRISLFTGSIHHIPAARILLTVKNTIPHPTMRTLRAMTVEGRRPWAGHAFRYNPVEMLL
jgi:hypothetical protein